MDDALVLESLIDLAREAAIEVRVIGAGPTADGLAPATSGVCRVRGRVWVLLSRRETPNLQIRALANALREHAAPLLEQRYLPPAVRACIFPEGGADQAAT